MTSFSHSIPHRKPGSNSGESDLRCVVRPERSSATLLSPLRDQAKRIPEGTIFAEVPLEACKAYPIHIFDGLDVSPRIAYADLNTHGEKNSLSVKLLPTGGKTAPHPQIVLFVNGPYHVETLGYEKSDPLKWTTWMEFHFDFRGLEQLIEGLMRAELKMKDLVI